MSANTRDQSYRYRHGKPHKHTLSQSARHQSPTDAPCAHTCPCNPWRWPHSAGHPLSRQSRVGHPEAFSPDEKKPPSCSHALIDCLECCPANPQVTSTRVLGGALAAPPPTQHPVQNQLGPAGVTPRTPSLASWATREPLPLLSPCAIKTVCLPCRPPRMLLSEAVCRRFTQSSGPAGSAARQRPSPAGRAQTGQFGWSHTPRRSQQSGTLQGHAKGKQLVSQRPVFDQACAAARVAPWPTASCCNACSCLLSCLPPPLPTMHACACVGDTLLTQLALPPLPPPTPPPLTVDGGLQLDVLGASQLLQLLGNQELLLLLQLHGGAQSGHLPRDPQRK